MRLSLLPLLPLILPLFAPFPTALASTASRSLPAVPNPHALHLNAEQRSRRAARAFPPGAGDIAAQVAAVEASFYRALAAQAGPTAGGDKSADERTRTTRGREAETARRTPAPATRAASFPSPAGDRAPTTLVRTGTRTRTRTRTSAAAGYPSSLAPPTTSSASSFPSPSSPATSTAPQPQSVLTSPLPGRTLAVLPMGLAFLTSALSFLLLMTAYMTYERMLYAAQFRARRAEAARRGAQLRALGLAAGVGNGEGRRGRGREWRV